MAKYMYGWDSVNHKKEYRGKYPDANPRGQGYFGLNDAGQRPDFVPKDWEKVLGLLDRIPKNIHFLTPNTVFVL